MALALVVAAAATAFACADIFGFKDLHPTDASVTTDGGDAGNACTTRAVSDSAGVFVTVNGADTSTCGTRTTPCLTVQTGINQAKLLGRSTVYIARGTYVESLQLAPNITLEGGWDTASSTWIPVCDTTEVTAVKITMPPSTNVVVTASFAGAAGLRLLSVLGKVPSATQPGESVYGIFATQAALTLDTIAVTMAAGGTGDTGTPGDAGAAGGIDCDAGGGAAGANAGNSGSGAGAGSFGSTGYAGATGGPGSADGSAGAPGTCTISSSCVTTCSTCQAICVNALAGCGGQPGLGGGGGHSGGSSIAVYGWNATVNIIGGSFTAGNGGTGGNGGMGGAGGIGGNGAVKDATCTSFCSVDAGCASVGNTSPQIGGMGGTGAPGGQGGGGSGGFSYAVFNGGDAGVVMLSSSPTLAFGDAGAGGVVNGAPGKAAGQGQ
jgi:hypothetical protein